MQSNTTCQILEQYLSYLSTIKGRSHHTIKEYRTDVLSFIWWVAELRGLQLSKVELSGVQLSEAELRGANSYCRGSITVIFPLLLNE